jgi:hypothetical protein
MTTTRTNKVFGVANIGLALVGLGQLMWNYLGYKSLPSDFLKNYGQFMQPSFSMMIYLSLFTLIPLGLLGIGLLKGRRNTAVFCNILYLMEIILFLLLLLRWNMAVSPFSPTAVALGLMNIGIALQIVTLYPVIAIIFLNYNKMSK